MLHTERPVVTVEVVPVERVRLRIEVVQGQETVTEQVQREQIVVDEHAVPGHRTARHAAPGAERRPQRRSARKRNRSRVAATSAASTSASTIVSTPAAVASSSPIGLTIRLSPTCSVPSPAVPTRLQPTT